MCGIAGIINKNQPLQQSSSLKLMTKSMINRGPDDEGYMLFMKNCIPFYGDDTISKEYKHIDTAATSSFKLGFGFRQLKIIDLSNKSHQPMSDLSQNYWIILNGEIYNYKEIRSELIRLGYTFFSNSDTEVVLNAYKEWNAEALHKFNGMFALSIFDKVKNEVFIARDRLGIKPLYFHENNEQFIFASTIKSIIDSKLYQPEINWEGLSQNFRFSIAQRPNTSFKNIKALEPAHYLIINLGTNKIQKKQFWEIPINNQDFSLTEKQSINLLDESLYNSIKYRLNADVEVGSFMSGGIDSTTLSVIASKINPNIKVLTLGFKEFEEYNEIKEAKDTAELNHLNHIIAYTNPNEIVKNLENIITAYEEPYHHLSANFILANMASKNNLKVVLNGLGGDELFGGYDVFYKLQFWNSLKRNKNIIKLIPNLHSKILKAKTISNYTNLDEFYAHYFTNYNDIEIKKLFRNKNISTKNTISNLYNKSNLNFTDDFEGVSFYNLKSYISNHQTRAVDHSTMQFSIEGRFPLLDHNFIETAFKIPSKYKLKNNTQKYILKQLAKKYIAPSCFSMQKKGLGLPLEHWIKNDFKNLINDTISTLKNRNIFNNNEIDHILKSNNERKIWQLVSTELWINKFIK
jgi:asparagine synthase (glutamine-hydrolysing)